MEIKITDIFSSIGRVKIIVYLAKEEKSNISKIGTDLSMNLQSVKKYLEEFIEKGIIEEEIIGTVRLFRYKKEIPKLQKLKELIEYWEEN